MTSYINPGFEVFGLGFALASVGPGPDAVDVGGGGSKRKYGERASSRASSGGSLDSRLSEDFGPGERSPSPEVSSCFGIPIPTERHTNSQSKYYHNRARKDTSDGPTRGSLSGGSNIRGAYLRTRRIIRAYLQNSPEQYIAGNSSSCASIAPSIEDPGAKLTRNAYINKTTSRPLDLMRQAVVKWETRKQFLEFTAIPRKGDQDFSHHDLRRRRTLATRLLSTSSLEQSYKSIVVRRFTKTNERLLAGLRAILALQQEECDFRQSSSPALQLLSLLSGESRLQSLVIDIVREILLDWPVDQIPAIVWLADQVPGLMNTAGRDMSKYARKVVQTAASWTSEWLAGFRLLFRGFKGVGTEDQALTLSLGKTLVYVGMEAIASQTDAWTRLRIYHYCEVLIIIRLAAKMSGSETFFAMIPSSVTLEKFWRACIGMLSARSSLDRSALALLALLRDVTGVLEDLSPSELQSLASSCLAAVLHTKVDDSYDLGVSGRLDPCVYSESRIHRTILEEDAFDILCRIPRPHFANAVAGALADCPILLDPFSPDHLELFGILEPLLWLSNMPKSIPEGHQALVEGGTCEFLSKIILAYPQESWSLQERGIWRIKGEAMTCLGNIIEKMNAAEELSRVQEDVVTAIVKIRDNEDAPSMQRDQAIFTLRRYKAAAVKNGVSPRCGEQL